MRAEGAFFGGLAAAMLLSLSAGFARAQADGIQPLSFRQIIQRVAQQGRSTQEPPSFCSRIRLDCQRKSWPVRLKGAQSDHDTKRILVGKIRGKDTVVLTRQDITKATGEFYVCDALGNLLRAYSTINDAVPQPLDPDDARASFDSEKQWWIDRISGEPYSPQ